MCPLTMPLDCRLSPSGPSAGPSWLLHLPLLFTFVLLLHPSLLTSAHYTEYNLADYCSEETWSDYPGRHRIRLEKSVKIRKPSIVDFHYNDTHRVRVGGGRPADYWPIGQERQADRRTMLVPYCLLTFYSDHGHRIYAEGFSKGLYNGGKDWFTETLHFKVGSSSSSHPSSGSTFSKSSEKNSLSLVFEQMHQGEFAFRLVLTPFRDGQPSTYSYEACDVTREYHCNNGRCIAHYLTCDHHNNCGDHSDEALNCLSNVPSTTSTTTTTTELPWYMPAGRPSEPSIPTFDITNGHGKQYPDEPSSSIPEYVDVPLPPNGSGGGAGAHHPPYYYPVNGHGEGGRVRVGGVDDSTFLRDLFAFEAKTSSAVHIVRYLLGVLVIIVLVTLINLFIWCVITKRDSSFMAPAPQPATPPPPLPAPTVPVFAV